MSRGLRWLGGTAAAVGLALAAAGCGGGSNAGFSGGGTGNGAAIAPAGAPVFVSIDTDQGSSQWKAADALLSKFPGKAQLLQSITKSLASGSGVDFNTLLSSVGPELDIVVLDVADASKNVVGLAKPSDEAAFDAALAKGSNPAVHVKIDGWTAFSDNQAALDRFKADAAKGTLADDATFKTAMGKLSGDALVKAFANGSSAATALGNRGLPTGALGGSGKLVSAVAELVATNDGLKLDATATTSGSKLPAPASDPLLAKVPGPALAYLSFDGKGITAHLQKALPAAGALSPTLGKFAPLLAQVSSLLEGHNALFVRTGLGLIPEVTLVTTPASPAEGVAALDGLLSQLGPGLKPQPLAVGSVQAKEVKLGQFSLLYGAAGANVIVTDQQQAFGELSAGGTKLADDATFKEAKDASGMPDATNGFLYVSLKDAVPLVESLAQLSGTQLSPKVTDNLKPLRTLDAWAATSGNDSSFTLFVEIK